MYDMNGRWMYDMNGGWMYDMNGGWMDDMNGGWMDDMNGGWMDDMNGGWMDDMNGGWMDDMNGGWMYDKNGGWMYDKNGLKSHRPRQATDSHIMCYNSLNALLHKRVYEAFVDDVECYLLVLCNLSIYTLFSPCHVLAHRCMLTLNLSQRRYLHGHRCQLHYVRVSSWFFRGLV